MQELSQPEAEASLPGQKAFCQKKYTETHPSRYDFTDSNSIVDEALRGALRGADATKRAEAIWGCETKNMMIVDKLNLYKQYGTSCMQLPTQKAVRDARLQNARHFHEKMCDAMEATDTTADLKKTEQCSQDNRNGVTYAQIDGQIHDWYSAMICLHGNNIQPEDTLEYYKWVAVCTKAGSVCNAGLCGKRFDPWWR